jgi:hypothetical protein
LSVTEETVLKQDLTLEQRVARVDTLLCILFGGLCRHPLANTLLPPDELTELRVLLGITPGPNEAPTTSSMGHSER